MKFDPKKYLRPWMHHPTYGQYIWVRMTFDGMIVAELMSHNRGWTNLAKFYFDIQEGKKEIDKDLCNKGYLTIKEIFESVV